VTCKRARRGEESVWGGRERDGWESGRVRKRVSGGVGNQQIVVWCAFVCVTASVCVCVCVRARVCVCMCVERVSVKARVCACICVWRE